MIAVDTNILVYAHRNESPWYKSAHAFLEQLWSGDARWLIPWPCLHEFYAVVTNKKTYLPPTSPQRASEQIAEWLSSDSIVTAAEGTGHWDALSTLIKVGHITGSKIYDAKIAAICVQMGVETFYTADRDYSLFPDLRCENPFVRRK